MSTSPVGGKIALGTVQFGMEYGVANRRGMPTEAEVAAILDLAAEEGITLLDTAQAYGVSESRIGAYLATNPGTFDVVTKLTPQAGASIAGLAEESRSRLGISRLYALLLHSFDSLTDNPGVWEELVALRSQSCAERLGLSLYYPGEWAYLLKQGLVPDLLQIPYSILDRRFEPHFAEMKEHGVEIHCRSAFLQGVVFMDAFSLPSGLSPLAPHLSCLSGLACDRDTSVAALALGFTLRNPLVDRIVFGVDTSEQLSKNIAALRDGMAVLQYIADDELDPIRCDDEDLVVPARWKN